MDACAEGDEGEVSLEVPDETELVVVLEVDPVVVDSVTFGLVVVVESLPVVPPAMEPPEGFTKVYAHSAPLSP